MFEINPGLSIWTTIVFIVLVLVLRKFAWRPILQVLEEREEKIRSSLEQAERARAEAAELLKQNERNMARAEEEYQRIIREAKTIGEKMKDEIIARAHQQAQRNLQLAREEIARETEAAKQRLRVEVADLAIRAAEKILDETLDAPRHRRLVENFLNELPRN